MWSIRVFGTLQCIVLAVQELLGAVYCTVCAGGLQYVWGWEGWGDGECVHGCGQISGRVLWLVVCCAGMYAGGCDVIVWAPCKAF